MRSRNSPFGNRAVLFVLPAVLVAVQVLLIRMSYTVVGRSAPDGRTADATLAGGDPLTDIAVLKIDAGRLPALAFAEP